jgi:hypothetical protein
MKNSKVVAVDKIDHSKLTEAICRKESRRKRLVANRSAIPSRDNQYCRISEHKV